MRTITQQSNPENPLIRKIGVQTITATLVLAMAFTFNACSSDDSDGSSGGGGSNFGGDVSPSGGVVSFANPQIFVPYYEDDMDGILSPDAYKGNGIIIVVNDRVCDPPNSNNCESVHLNAGNVTNGIIKLELPPTIPDEYLKDIFDEEEQQRFCTDYIEGIKAYWDDNSYFILSNSNGEYGELFNRYFYTDGQINIFGGIIYWYFSKAGRIACKEVQDDDDSFTFSINAKVGWNKIYYHVEDSYNYDEDIKIKPAIGEFSTNNILTKEKELKWLINLVND